MGSLASSRASILINRSPTKEFSITKGVRQGDPISPFLFIIAIEVLNISLRTACEKSLFHGVKIPHGGPFISHIFYADDALFVVNWSLANIKILARIL